jgi:arylsulfatase
MSLAAGIILAALLAAPALAQKAYEGFRGKVGKSFKDSQPWWPTPVQAPKGTPNILIVVVDDMGFADLGCYGSEIKTPNLDRLAAKGLRFRNFHTHPICSPSRACLLTGINSHAVGMGWIANSDPGYPGYRGEITKNAVTLAESLRENGYSTMAVGKWHLALDLHLTRSGPFDAWPTQRGFEHFYGILEGQSSYFFPPVLAEGNEIIEVTTYPKDFYATDVWTDKAIEMIKSHQAATPGKPFFLYLAYNAVHAPLHAKAQDLAKYKDRYQVGWNKVREERYQRQLQMGIIPKGTRLPPFNPAIKNWNELSPQDKELFARYQAIYAAMVDCVDQNFGKLYHFLKQTGELDKTIIVFVSDNGASEEGGPEGTSNQTRAFINLPTDKELDNSKLDLMGGPQTYPHYPLGWAQVSNTPLRFYKRHTYGGGIRVPFLISWPSHIKDPGAIRPQYAHMIDVVPMLLELTGIKHPATYQGRKVMPLQGLSFAAVLTDPQAPERFREQYYENEGNRAYYKDGWVLVTEHQQGDPFADKEWALYNVRNDFSETNNLAAKYPEKVKELARAFDQAARRYQVYPLDDRGLERILAMPPYLRVKGGPRTFYPGTPQIPRVTMMPLTAVRSYAITARFNYKPQDQGVIYAHGGQEGGYLLYVEDGRLFFEYNGMGKMYKLPAAAIQPGDLEVVMDLKALEKLQGQVTLAVNGKKVSEGKVFASGTGMEGLDIGQDSRGPVSWAVYEKHGAFPYTGKIESVSYVPGPMAPDLPFKME